MGKYKIAAIWLLEELVKNVKGKYVIPSTLSGCAIAQAVGCWLPTTAALFESRSGHVGFVLDRVALGQVFSENFSFLCQFSFHWLLHIQHRLSSGAGTIGQLVADVPSGLSLTPTQKTN
jgi:hypothetical protein